jgi:DNA repair protein RadC
MLLKKSYLYLSLSLNPMTVKLTKAQKIQVLKAKDIFMIMRDILMHENKIDRDKEHFWLVCLSANNHILMIELISLGSVTSTIVEPMDVFSFALQKRAVKLIMVHNHPSGEMRPSRPDIDLTERMHAIGKFIRVPVIDHLIISEKEFYSFVEAGLMEKIETEKRYDLTFGEMDKLTAQLKKAEKEKTTAVKEKAKEIAKNLLDKGVNIDIIMSASGLTKKQVESLKKKD